MEELQKELNDICKKYVNSLSGLHSIEDMQDRFILKPINHN